MERHTSEAHAFIVRFVNEELEDLLGHELTRFTNTDRKFARRTFGDSDVAVVLRELHGKGSYNQHLQKEVIGRGERGEESYRRRPCFPRRRPSDDHQRRRRSP